MHDSASRHSARQPAQLEAAGLEDFAVRVPIEVRFRDTDAMGHVNNAVYLTYFEVGRMAYWDRLIGGGSYEDVPFVLARAEIDFKAPAHVGERLTLGLSISRVGNRSFDFDYLLRRDADGTVVAVGRTVQVVYDYETGRSKPIDDALRERIEAFEGD